MELALVLKYWREIALALLVIAIVGAGLYVRHVFNERDDLRAINTHLSSELASAQRVQELTNRVTEAISQIRIRSNVNVTKIESDPKPEFVDADPIPFIAGGVLPAVYSSGAAGGTAPDHAAGPVVAAKGSGGGVLSDRPGPAEHLGQPGVVPGGPGVGQNDAAAVQRRGQGD
jgi:hypothetical protein